ncbi:MAG TPA: hypothetical protein VI915_05780 [Thermoplasmata archaeon]|nr:hypothetical protein [Thermoplasmata archaeon]
MDLTVRALTEADLPALVAIQSAQNDFGGRWFTNPFAGGKEARYEDLTPAQRWLHGGPWMDPRLLALHVRRISGAGGAVRVAERDGVVAGAVELWPAEEPLPIGAYLDIGMVTTQPPDDAGTERALLESALREARRRDLRALDIAPLHAGGDPGRWTGAGFRVLLEHRTVHLPADRKPTPPAYSVLHTAPALADLPDFLALDHREPPAVRVGNLGNGWAEGLLTDVSQSFGGRLRVDLADVGVTGRVCTWTPEREAEIDLWAPTAGVGNLPWLRRAVAAAVDYVARHHRVARFRTTVPTHLVPALEDLGFEDGGDPDPWLRRHVLVDAPVA